MAAIENVRRAEEDIADAPEDAHGAEENMPDAIEDVQRTEEDIAEAIEDVQGAEENISDATEDVQGGEEDHHTKMMCHQGLESRNPSLGTEIQDKMEVSEEFQGGEEEDIPMTNSEQLKQVHQTYRKMECDRRSYHISTEGTMRQQQALLENMKSENCAFKEMLDTYVIKDYQQQMNNLLEQADKLQSMVEIETRRVKDLDNSITELASKEMDAKRATGGCKAAWEKHKSTQIQIQITENRLEKATVDLNIVQGRTKSLQEDMEKLRREQDLYSNVYMKMEKEHSAKETATEQCIEDIYNAYKETNIYQQQISELLKMSENLHNYYTWLNTNGWAIQDPMPFTQMRFEIPDGSMHKEKDRCSLVGSKGIKIIQENNDEGGMKELSGNKIVKDQHVIASIDYKQWIEMKSLEDIQDVLKIDDVEDILPSFLDACKQDANIYENITHLIQEISELDSMLPENILPIPNVETDSKRSFESQKVQMDKMLEALLESLKYLCIDDVMYFPMIEGLKKQIVLIFKEAGCDVGDKDLELEDHSALELVIRKWFSKLEHFVDQTLS